MHYLTLDTNTWIYLANGTEPTRLLTYIKDAVDRGNITLILPKTIITEWDRNKHRTSAQGGIRFSQEISDGLGKIKMMFDNQDNVTDFEREFFESHLDEKQQLVDLIVAFESKQSRIKIEVNKIIKDNIDLIDTLFAHPSTVVPIVSPDALQKSTEFASELKAPFHKKHSPGDAYIVFSFLDYVKTNSIEGASFVTYNTEDFCEKVKGKNVLHSDLQPEFDAAKSKFYTALYHAINPIKGLITKYEQELIESIKEDIEYEIEYCRVCEEMSDRVNEVYFYSGPVDLNDEREGLKYYDPEQIGLEFDSDYPTRKSDAPYHSIIVGHCNWCNTEHFKCASCGTVNAVWEGEYGEKKECEGGCGLVYRIERPSHPDEIDESEYTILKDSLTCAKCGNEFKADGGGGNVCVNCEEEDSYGKAQD